VRSIPLLAVLLAVAVAPTTAVGAGPAGFSDPMAIGTGPAGLTAAAVSADGHAALAWPEFIPGGETVLHVALRDAPARPWRTSRVAVDALGIRDPQLVIAPNGDTVLAWAGFAGGRRHPDLALVTAPPGGDFGVVRRVAVGNAFLAFPRLVVLRSGAVLFAFRDARLPRGTARLRVALRPASGGRFGPPRAVATGAANLALAASGSGAVMAWSAPPAGRGAARALYALRLDGHGWARGAAALISPSVGAAAIRLAGSPDGQSIVSWEGPGRYAGARFTRMVEPSLHLARPLPAPVGTPFGGAAAVTMGVSGRALAAATALGAGGVRVFAGRSAFGGPWTDRQELTAQPAPVLGSPRPVLLASGEALVLWLAPRAQPGPPVYDVLLARRAPAQAAFAPPEAVSGSATGDRANGLVVATGGEHILVAWPAPAPAGGMLAAERG
jgi:hypothetical protein